jgi:hypothetical protein
MTDARDTDAELIELRKRVAYLERLVVMLIDNPFTFETVKLRLSEMPETERLIKAEVDRPDIPKVRWWR